jgi:hypothetical protein
MGCPLHPETMMGAQLAVNGIKSVRKLRAEFRTLRMPDKENPNPHIVEEQFRAHELADLLG